MCPDSPNIIRYSNVIYLKFEVELLRLMVFDNFYIDDIQRLICPSQQGQLIQQLNVFRWCLFSFAKIFISSSVSYFWLLHWLIRQIFSSKYQRAVVNFLSIIFSWIDWIFIWRVFENRMIIEIKDTNGNGSLELCICEFQGNKDFAALD